MKSAEGNKGAREGTEGVPVAGEKGKVINDYLSITAY